MKQLELPLDGVTKEDLDIASKVHEFYPPRYLEIISDSSDLYTRIPLDADPVDFIINHLRHYKSVHVSAIRVFYYDVDLVSK